ncbi:MAG TPA: alpha/beta fold hydrolase, partial [Acidimicrobiales bacterium]|nr:alpha/beta fold hydrolase [Acidimicrobiales bacterium]
MVERTDTVIPGAGVDLETITFAAGAPSAAVVLLHGWGGSAETMVAPAEQLAALGYLAVAVSLRGWGRSGGTDDCGLRQPDDVAAVVDWIGSAHPRCAPRVGLLGISQGGQVALLAAARGPAVAVAAVAAWAPVTDVALWRRTTEYPGIPGYIDAVCADGDLARRSPLAVAADLAVPLLLVHGGADTRVPTDQSRLLQAAVARAGGDARLEV